MEYVIAGSSEADVARFREILRDVPGVEFRVGSVPETGADCDAVILNPALAHERYGGTPRIGEVQVLINRNEDGAPEIILAAAPVTGAMAAPDDAQTEEFVYRLLDSCVTAFWEHFPDRTHTRLLVHLEGAAIDRPDAAVPARGVLRSLQEARG
ncbi:hypothetical protein WKI68_29870 [Streptomyces sp. MS1.HAVA.3]|uniref:Uncharacterized protein n=1 Tax=Streptomyces caledonius TaxID=3134107 RepID=A0ABU8U919_9ACTN